MHICIMALLNIHWHYSYKRRKKHYSKEVFIQSDFAWKGKILCQSKAKGLLKWLNGFYIKHSSRKGKPEGKFCQYFCKFNKKCDAFPFQRMIVIQDFCGNSLEMVRKNKNGVVVQNPNYTNLQDFWFYILFAIILIP